MEQLCRKLRELGVDTDGVIARLGGNEQLYLSICRKFINDASFLSAKNAFTSGDFMDAQVHIHTLKGVSANLGFSMIHSICERLLTELDQYDLEKFNEDMNILTREYDKIIALIVRG
ncbi:MAG: hypothetical protein K0R46_1298 [Herbinix sp.]|jgi:HPt (histidine-containing phosphotransfer) domain-containing protein|nr:hypothetical protein [Herbinix sp.]